MLKYSIFEIFDMRSTIVDRISKLGQLLALSVGKNALLAKLVGQLLALSVPIIDKLTSTCGAWHLVARACAPVCPSLDTLLSTMPNLNWTHHPLPGSSRKFAKKRCVLRFMSSHLQSCQC